MAYDYIKRGKAEENGYTNTKVFKMFGISSTGYYNYVARKEDRNGKLAAKMLIAKLIANIVFKLNCTHN